jgi:hypothetical protein
MDGGDFATDNKAITSPVNEIKIFFEECEK